MEANGLPFMEALQKLAHQAGLQMPQFSQKDKQANEERKSLYEIMEQACKFFEQKLRMPEGREGLSYFTQKRSMTEETLKKFRLGYAPNNNGLMAFLKAQGVTPQDMKELGLIAIPEDTARHPHDFFRNRVMIPITNKQGKIIAFGGRVMEKIEPKYLNSPDTPIFNKRRNLYNLDKARESGYKERNLIICEGYMDVMALDSFGIEYAVAPLGTALTEEQIMEAWKVCPEPIVCLDGDAPGVKAAMRAVDRVLPILKAGYSLKFMFLPDNMDPDEFLRQRGAAAFHEMMRHTEPLINILWRKYTQDEDSSTPERKALIEKTLLAEVTKITDSTVRSYYAQDIRTRIFKAFKQTPWQSAPAPQPYRQPTYNKPQPAYLNEIPLADTAPYTPKTPLVMPQPRPTPQPYQRRSYTPNNRRNANARQLLNHTISADPEELRKSANTEQDKNIRFVIAAEIMYPDLIAEFEEQIYQDNIKSAEIKALYNKVQEIYQTSEETLTSPLLRQALMAEPYTKTLNELWELNMLERKDPLINEIRKDVTRIVLEDRLRALEEEKKKLGEEMSKNFNEETYLRLKEIKEEQNQILAEADKDE